MDNKFYDVAIIGSGAAGIMSAITLQNDNLKVILIDDSFSLGGQFFKNVEENQDEKNKKLFGPEYSKGIELINELDINKIVYKGNASVWSIDKSSNIYYSKDNKSYTINAKKIIIATGSQERPYALKGWDKPGVLSATAAQIMLKESSLIKDDAVFVGSGPLFYYVISQYIDAGAKIKAIIDTTPKINYLKSLKYLPKALKNAGILFKGLGFLLKFRKHKIKVHQFIKNVEFIGENKLQKILFDNQTIETNLAFIHNGLVPNINLQLQAGCDYEYCNKKRSIDIKVNEFKQSSLDNIFVIGDSQSIKGVEVALIEAKIASLKILYDFNKITIESLDEKLKKYENELNDVSCMRDFLNALYLPSKEILQVNNDETIVCRCEEVKKIDIVKSLKIDSKGLNTIKTFTRCAMGNCQGRFCGLSLLEIVAKQTNTNIEELKYLNIRSPIKPVRIEELVNLEEI
jgi:thioredoxin reductase